MLAWPDAVEWQRDNRWRSLDTVPTDRPVDVFCHGYDRSRERTEPRTSMRVHGVWWDGKAWSGIPAGYTPQFWTDAMPAARIRALSA